MPRRTLAAFDLKAARKVRGLSQAKTALILCATQPSVARWEAQGNMPEVFRKVWALYWQLEDSKHATDSTASKSVRKSHTAKRATKSVAKTTARSREDIQRRTSEDVPDDAGTV